jgi:hypothetical protein
MVGFHRKLPKTEKYQIYDFDLIFFFGGGGVEMKARERKNGMAKRDSGQGV